ncbi:TPA: hypothetical protein ACGO3D_001322 [Streptococcus suis]
MKIKRNSGKKQLHKWAKLGVAFASVAVLGGVVAPVNGQLLNTSSVAYAQEKTTEVLVSIAKVSDGGTGVDKTTYSEVIPTGISKTYKAPFYEGYELLGIRASLYDSNKVIDGKGGEVTLPSGFIDSEISIVIFYEPTEKTVEPPVEKPAETKPTASSSSTSQSSASKPSTSSTQPSATKPTETKVTEDQVSTSPVYRLYHEDLKVHLYTRDAYEYKVLAGRGWRQEGQAFLSASKGSPVYRLYHEGLKVHLYTRDAHEYKVLAGRGWRQEGTAFYSVTDGTPVYRLYNEGLKKHLYTTDANEYKVLATRGWTQEGIAFYSAK